MASSRLTVKLSNKAHPNHVLEPLCWAQQPPSKDYESPRDVQSRGGGLAIAGAEARHAMWDESAAAGSIWDTYKTSAGADWNRRGRGGGRGEETIDAMRAAVEWCISSRHRRQAQKMHAVRCSNDGCAP